MASNRHGARDDEYDGPGPPDDLDLDVRPTTPHVRRSDPSEIPFLPARKAAPWSRALVHGELAGVRASLAESDSTHGELVHTVATRVRMMYAHYAERTLGYATFAMFAREELGLPTRMLFEWLRVSKHFTAKEATALGLSICLRGVRLLELTGATTIKALRSRDLETESGAKIRFPATRKQLQSAIRVLREQARFEAESKLPRRFRLRASRLNRQLAALSQEHPELERLRARFVPTEDDVMLQIGRINLLQSRALARVLLALEDGPSPRNRKR